MALASAPGGTWVVSVPAPPGPLRALTAHAAGRGASAVRTRPDVGPFRAHAASGDRDAGLCPVYRCDTSRRADRRPCLPSSRAASRRAPVPTAGCARLRLRRGHAGSHSCFEGYWENRKLAKRRPGPRPTGRLRSGRPPAPARCVLGGAGPLVPLRWWGRTDLPGPPRTSGLPPRTQSFPMCLQFVSPVPSAPRLLGLDGRSPRAHDRAAAPAGPRCSSSGDTRRTLSVVV